VLFCELLRFLGGYLPQRGV
jgi:hypothetical protein